MTVRGAGATAADVEPILVYSQRRGNDRRAEARRYIEFGDASVAYTSVHSLTNWREGDGMNKRWHAPINLVLVIAGVAAAVAGMAWPAAARAQGQGQPE